MVEVAGLGGLILLALNLWAIVSIVGSQGRDPSRLRAKWQSRRHHPCGLVLFLPL